MEKEYIARPSRLGRGEAQLKIYQALETPGTAKEVEARTGLSKGSVGPILRLLLSRGVLERTRHRNELGAPGEWVYRHTEFTLETGEKTTDGTETVEKDLARALLDVARSLELLTDTVRVVEIMQGQERGRGRTLYGIELEIEVDV